MSDAGFDFHDTTGDVEAASTTTSKVIPEQNFIGAPKDKEEAESKAREHNWPDKVPYDYSSYQPGAAAAKIDEIADLLAPLTIAGAAVSAARYEWKDEFGDVGPEIPQLEEILFTPADKFEAGSARHHIDGIHMEIVAKDEPKPIREVRLEHFIPINTSDFCS
jgi:ATP-dependent RNA helicase DDX3X